MCWCNSGPSIATDVQADPGRATTGGLVVINGETGMVQVTHVTFKQELLDVWGCTAEVTVSVGNLLRHAKWQWSQLP